MIILGKGRKMIQREKIFQFKIVLRKYLSKTIEIFHRIKKLYTSFDDPL